VLRTAALKGKVVVVEYWASWCPFCKNTMPHLQKLYDANKAKGLEVIVLSIDKTEREAVDALRERGFTFRAGMATDDINRVFGRLRGLPVTYVIGRDGKLARQEMGELFAEDVAEFADLLRPAR
jgi:thiol-disulfide isomerase/thioredoxin